MAAVSRRKSLLHASARRVGAGQDPPDLPPEEPPSDPDVPLDALEADDLAADDADDTPAPSASVRTARPGGSVDVVESQVAGTGFRTEARDDMWPLDEPNSEEVRLDPVFRRLLFGEASAAPADETPSPPPPSLASQGRLEEPVRRKLGAVESATSNRPGGRGDADPTPAVKAPPSRPAPRPPEPAATAPAPAAPASAAAVPGPAAQLPGGAYGSAPPQPQAAQDRVASKQWADAPTARLPADMFGTPKPSTRVAAPEAVTLRSVVPDVPARPPEVDDAVPATAGVLALGGAAMVSLSVAAVLVVLILSIGLYLVVAGPGTGAVAPVEASVGEAPVGEASAGEAPVDEGDPAAPPTPEPGDPAAEVPVDEAGAPPAPGPRRRTPKPAEPVPEPVVVAPAPAPAVPAPAPPPPDPAPSEDEDDKKGRKRKKK